MGVSCRFDEDLVKYSEEPIETLMKVRVPESFIRVCARGC